MNDSVAIVIVAMVIVGLGPLACAIAAAPRAWLALRRGRGHRGQAPEVVSGGVAGAGGSAATEARPGVEIGRGRDDHEMV